MDRQMKKRKKMYENSAARYKEERKALDTDEQIAVDGESKELSFFERILEKLGESPRVKVPGSFLVFSIALGLMTGLILNEMYCQSFAEDRVVIYVLLIVGVFFQFWLWDKTVTGTTCAVCGIALLLLPFYLVCITEKYVNFFDGYALFDYLLYADVEVWRVALALIVAFVLVLCALLVVFDEEPGKHARLALFLQYALVSFPAYVLLFGTQPGGLYVDEDTRMTVTGLVMLLLIGSAIWSLVKLPGYRKQVKDAKGSNT